MITGESLPIEKKEGDLVIAGTVNTTGSFLFEAKKVGHDTMLASIIELVRETQTTKAPIQELADKIASVFVPFVLLMAAVTSILWLLLGQPIAFAINCAVSVLIIACPCALGLATPTAIMVGTGLAAQKGILIKNAKALQELQDVSTFIFDKTGTLTKGQPKITDVIPQTCPAELLIQYAASLESLSEHPIAKAIVGYAIEKKIHVLPVENFEAKIGEGINGTISNRLIQFGKNKDKKEHPLEKEGKTVLWLYIEGKECGVIAVADTIKDSAKQLITTLKNAAIETILLSGDNEKTTKAIADQCGITTYYANMLPRDKAATIKKLQSGGKKVAMIGDGINDAPALTQANVGIAMGSGTDIAIESADIVLINTDLMTIFTAYQLSQKTFKKIKQNLFWAFFYNAIGLQIAAGILYPVTGILLNPMVAGFAMAMSSVSVLSNTLLLKIPTQKFK